MKRLAGIALTGMIATAGAAGTDLPACGGWKRLLEAPNALLDHILLTSSIAGGEEQYFNVDVDADDVSDEIIGGCPASLQSGDPCELSVRLSTGAEQSFTFDVSERFFLARYRSRVYAIVSHTSADTKRLRSVISIDHTGIKRLCTWP